MKAYAAETDVDVPIAATDELLSYFSDWYKLKKAVARILQFREYLLCKVRKEVFDCKVLLTVDDMREAEQAILKYVQAPGIPS